MTDTKVDPTDNFVVESDDTQDIDNFVSNESDDVLDDAETEKETDSSKSDINGELENADDDGETEDSLADDASAELKPKKKANRVQERINEVVRQREEGKRKNRELEKQIEALKKLNPTVDKEPQEADFEDYEDYIDALDKYDKSFSENETAKKEPVNDDDNGESKKDKLTDDQEDALAVIRDFIANTDDMPSDFNTIALNPDIAVTGEMLEAIALCDNPTKVMYYLGTNKDIALNIANKSPATQMREIAKLDFAKEVKPKPANLTESSDPISPVRGGDIQKKPLSKMSYSEFEQERRLRGGTKSNW